MTFSPSGNPNDEPAQDRAGSSGSHARMDPHAPMDLQPLRIGSFVLESPVLSAPVAGFTDLAYRSILREFGGCGLIYTEMVSAGGWIIGDQDQPARLEGVRDEPKPVGVQLWDREPSMVEEGARRLQDYGVSVIDLNFGCPKKRIMGKQGAGATLLRDPDTIGRMVESTVRGAGSIPVTAKIRLGASIACATAPAVARAAESAGAAAVTVHGRTADDSYSVPVNLEKIREVVDCVAIPVIANGDIDSAEMAIRVFHETGAAGVMIARKGLSRPWIFREITAALRGQPIPAGPTLAEQIDQLLRHLDALIERGGERWGAIRMRKFAGRYLAGVRGAREFRQGVASATTGAEFRTVVERCFPEEFYSGGGTVDSSAQKQAGRRA